MNENKYSWHKIADSINEISWQENGLFEIEVKGKKICLVNKEHQLYACTNKCPHAGGRISDGYVDAKGDIVCPLHRYRFSLENGRNTSGEGYFLKTYKIEERENGIYIGIEESKGILGWLG